MLAALFAMFACLGPSLDDQGYGEFVGEWSMETQLGDGTMAATMGLFLDGARLRGTWESQGMTMDLTEIRVKGTTIRFLRQIPQGPTLVFEGVLKGDRIEGFYDGSFGELSCRGTRKALGVAEPKKLHNRPVLERDGKTLVWANHDDGTGNVAYFDMTNALIDPFELQYGIGKDTIRSIDEPQFVRRDDPRLEAMGIVEGTSVIGVEIEGVSKAYPVSSMNRHEVVNDSFSGTPYAVFW